MFVIFLLALSAYGSAFAFAFAGLRLGPVARITQLQGASTTTTIHTGKRGGPSLGLGHPPRRFLPGYVVPWSLLVGALLKYTARKVAKRWVAVKAYSKFEAAGGWFGIYATIPLLAGLVNMATNKLAVIMIFSPLEFMGVELIQRKKGQPAGLFGWQGIVPAKVSKMGADVADTLLSLIDLREVFSRLSSDVLADTLLNSNLARIIDDEIRSLQPLGLDKSSPLFEAGGFYQKVLNIRLRACLIRILDRVKADPAHYLDLKATVVNSLESDKKVIVELFQRCGAEELAFIVWTGLWGGFGLGVVQMLVWLLWPRPWTLAVGGALVGYITDWFALKILFEPVEPVELFGFKLQGLFLQRQKQVSSLFSKFMSTKLLTSRQLWTALATGSRSKEGLETTVKEELKKELSSVFLSHASEQDWDSFSHSVCSALPQCAASSFEYCDKALRLEDTINNEMLQMKSAQFERVLHPIFQEDELTLILVGSILGGLSGLLQVPFY